MLKVPPKPKAIRKFKIPSESEPGEYYTVRLWNTGDLDCECMAFLYHPQQPCKHIKKVERFLKREKIKKYL